MTGQYYTSTDDQQIFCHQWETPTPRGVLLVAHGGAEHGARYATMAKSLNRQQYSVWVADHRGHGESLLGSGQLGDMGNENVWRQVVDDMLMLARNIRTDNPGVPIFLLGHSLGSLVAQMALIEYSSLFTGAILSGAPSLDTFAALKPVLEALIEANGREAVDDNLQAELIANFNSVIDNPRTDSDWISSDAAVVDKYKQDPLCGFAYPNGVWLDIVTASEVTQDIQALSNIDSEFPIYIFSGENDPVHLNQTGLTTLMEQYRQAGISDIQLTVYEGGRHEMFNETQRSKVVNDLVGWMNKKTPSA